MEKNLVAVGLTVDRFKGITPSALIKVVKKLGLEFVELTISVFDDLESCRDNIGNMKTGFHLPNLHDTGFDFSCKKMDEKIQQLIRLINDNYQALNVKYCLAHPPEDDSGADIEETISYLLENLKKLEPSIIIENIQSWDENRFQNFYDQAKLVLGDKLIGLCFDAPHHILSGGDPVDFINNSNGEIRCIHLSDCEEGFDAHMPFGSGGCLPVDEILKTIKKVDYNGFINLELLPRSQEDILLIIKSYLKVVKTFDKKKYFASLFRLFLFKSKLEKTLKNVL
ncbi:TIM barrel protein [candidate division KSB1 bacterium]|nr:TIM barrel protein [candidate division KSB1 bacterium]MBL7095709.1 TIM barrel protein [candidate division KSB1 bacterium]